MNWPLVKLGDLCVVKRGTTITQKEAIEGKVPVVGGGLKPTYFHNSSNRNGNTITVSGSGASAGFINFYKEPIFASDCSTVEPKNDTVDVSYIYRAMQNLQEYIYTKLKAGAAQPHVYAKDLANLEIPFPPLAEQHRIAALLDTADHIIKQRELAIAKLDQLAQSVFVDMFGSQTLEVHKLSTICDLQNGYAFKSDDYVDESDVLNCRMSNIRPNGDFDIFYNARYLHNNFSEKYKEFLLNDGDVIIAMTDMAGEPKILGVPTIVVTKGKKLLLNQRVGKLVFKKQDTLNVDYLKFALTQRSVKNYFKKFANGGVQINLGKTDLLSVPIAIPSYEQQINFSHKIQKIFRLKEVENIELQKLIKLQSSLQHQSFAVN